MGLNLAHAHDVLGASSKPKGVFDSQLVRGIVKEKRPLWDGCRQPFPYPITEGSPVIRPFYSNSLPLSSGTKNTIAMISRT